MFDACDLSVCPVPHDALTICSPCLPVMFDAMPGATPPASFHLPRVDHAADPTPCLRAEETRWDGSGRTLAGPTGGPWSWHLQQQPTHTHWHPIGRARRLPGTPLQRVQPRGVACVLLSGPQVCAPPHFGACHRWLLAAGACSRASQLAACMLACRASPRLRWPGLTVRHVVLSCHVRQLC